MLVLIAQALGRDAGTGEKNENRGENKGKPTTISPFKAIWQKEHHHRTNRSFRQRQINYLPWQVDRRDSSIHAVSSQMVPLSNESMAADSVQCSLVPSSS